MFLTFCCKILHQCSERWWMKQDFPNQNNLSKWPGMLICLLSFLKQTFCSVPVYDVLAIVVIGKYGSTSYIGMDRKKNGGQ